MKKILIPILVIVLVVAIVGAFFIFRLTPEEKEAITSVSTKINAIGEVNLISRQSIEDADKAFNSLDEKLQRNVENSESLANAKTTFNILLTNDIMQSISNIGLVTVESKQSIDLANDAYNALTDEQKAMVNNSDELLKAKETYNQLKGDEVIDAINRIGVVTTNSKPPIDMAFEKYNPLTDEQKALVSNFDDLLKAKDLYNQLRANEVIKSIDRIGDVKLSDKRLIETAKSKFDSLTLEQQKLVTNFEKIQSSSDELSKLEIANVIGLIDVIGEIDLNSSPEIETAKKAYEALTPSQKELITNYTRLEKSIEDFSVAQVTEVILKIDSIGDAKVENKPKVIEARASYEQLDSGQKIEVTNYGLLESIEQTLTGLEVAEINKLIAGLNVNYPQKSDWDNCDKIYHLLENLPEIERTTGNFKDFVKFDKLYNTFQDYFKAVNYANNGQYEEAYNLMDTLNIMDSKQLASEYEKIVFKWWVEGGMTKSTYGRSEFFEVAIEVFGGKDGESIDILFICSTPGWTNSGVVEDLYSGSGQGYYFWNTRPENAKQGIGKMTIKNNSTGETLAEYKFYIKGN